MTRLGRLASALVLTSAAVLGLAPAGRAYEAVTVSDGGTIQGKVTFPGSPPPKRKVIPTKDREACGSTPRDVDQLRAYSAATQALADMPIRAGREKTAVTVQVVWELA